MRRAAAVALELFDPSLAPPVPEERKRRKLTRYLRAARHNEDGDRQVALIAKRLLTQLSPNQAPTGVQEVSLEDEEELE